MAGRVGLEPTTSRFTVEVTVFYTTPAAVDHSGSRAKGDKFGPFDGCRSAPLGQARRAARCGASSKRRNAADGPICSHPSGRALLAPGVVGLHLWWDGTTASKPPSQRPKSPRSNDPNLSPFALADDGVRSVGRSRCRHHEWRTRCIVVVIANCNSRLFFCRGDLI